eukprot:scaffold79569_cov21-Tisochrysis_lutea.AAC.2
MQGRGKVAREFRCGRGDSALTLMASISLSTQSSLEFISDLPCSQKPIVTVASELSRRIHPGARAQIPVSSWPSKLRTGLN